MELPQYISRQAAPGSSGLAPASPNIVGGALTAQGIQSFAHAMLIQANEEERQGQAEDVASAGLVVGKFARTLLAKEQELADRRATDPTLNPRSLHQEYANTAMELHQAILDDATIASRPRMRKHVVTHMETALQQHLQHHQTKTNADWAPWYQLRGASTLEELSQAASQAEDPIIRETLSGQAHDVVNGMVLLRQKSFGKH